MLAPGSWTLFAAAIATAVVAAIVIVAVVTIPVRLLARRNTWDPRLLGRIRRPFRVLAIAVAVWIAVATAFPTELADWRGTVDHALLIVVIAASGWFLAALVGFLFARYVLNLPTFARLSPAEAAALLHRSLQ